MDAFWCDIPYGTESQFNPLSALVNEGGDILQLEGHDNRFDSILTPSRSRRLASSLSHPIEAIDRAGWGEFVGTEILPMSARPSRAAWIPNWQVHLVGGGITNQRLEDWYRAHGCGSPFLPALFTSYAGHLLNETAEIGGIPDGTRSTDPVADIYLFDAAGIALLHVPAVRSFFLSTVEIANWPLQPSIGADRSTLENAGQYYAIKAPLPGSEDWKIFYHFGLGNIAGASRRVGAADAISLGAGVYARRIESLDQTTNRVELSPKVGLFWDRNNSLLASAFLNGQSNNRFSVQIHPGVLPTGPARLGGWVAFDDECRPSGGITTVIGLGVGTSGRSRD